MNLVDHFRLDYFMQYPVLWARRKSVDEDKGQRRVKLSLYYNLREAYQACI